MAEPLPKPAPDQGTRIRRFSVPSRWIEDEDFRLDATTYSEEAYQALLTLRSYPRGAGPLGALIARAHHPTENQARSNFKRIWAKAGEGVPFLTGRQLLFFRPVRDKFISRRMPKLDELMVPEGCILLSRSGTTGHPVLVGKWLAQFAVTDDALRIQPGEAPIGFIYAFLASSLAQALMTKSEYGKVVSHIEAKHVTAIPVPRLPGAVRRAVHKKITRAFALRDEANERLDEADKDLHALLGVSPFEEGDIEYLGRKDETSAFVVASAEIGERLDAKHHVPLARSAVHKLERGRFKLVPLGKQVGDGNVYVAPRFARIYVEEEYGTPLLQGSQLPLIRPYGLGYISSTRTERIERWLIRAGWVLVTCSGTIGRVAVSTGKQDGWAASQHILRIMPPPGVAHPGFLAAFLATPFGQHQLKAKIYGGVVDELTAKDTAAVMVPDVPFDEQRRLGDVVVRAYEMREKLPTSRARRSPNLKPRSVSPCGARSGRSSSNSRTRSRTGATACPSTRSTPGRRSAPSCRSIRSASRNAKKRNARLGSGGGARRHRLPRLTKTKRTSRTPWRR